MHIHHVDVGCNEAERVVLIEPIHPATEPSAEHKYNRPITGMDGTKATVDVYRVLSAFKVVDPEIQHSIKKLLMPGVRGKGDRMQDIMEAKLSLEKLIERMEQEKC
jgi:hypothetical protein